jgi:hypothetical protein
MSIIIKDAKCISFTTSDGSTIKINNVQKFEFTPNKFSTKKKVFLQGSLEQNISTKSRNTGKYIPNIDSPLPPRRNVKNSSTRAGTTNLKLRKKLDTELDEIMGRKDSEKKNLEPNYAVELVNKTGQMAKEWIDGVNTCYGFPDSITKRDMEEIKQFFDKFGVLLFFSFEWDSIERCWILSYLFEDLRDSEDVYGELKKKGYKGRKIFFSEKSWIASSQREQDKFLEKYSRKSSKSSDSEEYISREKKSCDNSEEEMIL